MLTESGMFKAWAHTTYAQYSIRTPSQKAILSYIIAKAANRRRRESGNQ